MKGKQETLSQIVQLLDMRNLSLRDVENFRKGYYRNVARHWLKDRHKPGWFVNEEGFSAETLEELDILDPEFEPFGIWLNETIIVCPNIMHKKDNLSNAEKFILGTSLGPFYYRLPTKLESVQLVESLNVVSEALVRCGRENVPTGTFWTGTFKRSEHERAVAINNTEQNNVAYSTLDKSHLGIFVINVG